MGPEYSLQQDLGCATTASPYSNARRICALLQQQFVKHPCWSDEQGQSLVEVSLTFAILIMVVIGIMQVGMALHAYDTVADAARTGSRYAMVHGSTCTGCIASSSSIQTYVQNLGLQLPNPSTLTVTTTWPDKGASCTPSSTPCNNKGNNVKITVVYPFQMQIPFVPSGTWNLSSTSEMVIAH